MLCSHFASVFSEILRYDSVPKDMEMESKDKRQELVEAVSNVDDQLGEMFLEEKMPTNDQLMVFVEKFSKLSNALFLTYLFLIFN